VISFTLYLNYSHKPTEEEEALVFRRFIYDQMFSLQEEKHMCDFAIGLETTPKFLYTRVRDMMNSWLKRLCPDDEHLLPNFAFISTEHYHNLWIEDSECEDDWGHVCCKTEFLFRLLFQRFPDKEWYMKCDDDTFVVPKNMDEIMEYYNPSLRLLLGGSYYIRKNKDDEGLNGNGNEGDIPSDLEKDEFFLYPGGGSGYIFSRAMMKALHEDNFETFHQMCQKYFFEDIAASKVCEKMDCHFIPLKGFYNEPPSDAAKQWPHFFHYLPVSFHLQHETKDVVELDKVFSGPPKNASKG